MQMPNFGLATKVTASEEEGVSTGESGSELSEADLATIIELQQLSELQNNLSMAQDFDNTSGAFDFDSNSKPMWDMLHIQFSIRSEKYIPSAHIAFIFQLAEKAEGEPVMSWFHFLSLEDISPEEKSYDYRLAAYPDGMHVVSQEAFLFANGTEIATNLSAKHVAMKEKDARVFLKYQYLAENTGKTRPPDRAWKYLDPDLRQRINQDIQDRTITLKIDSEGQVQDIITTSDVRAVLSPKGIQEIASLIYLPALEDGKPVPGELVLRLGDVILN
jgi:hypothetical protein